ncbi:MAG: hypothetical protein ICV83_04125 [Cytophagales bacterium]|nr:hypothetical protein [Cytophagales bacterium]
MRPLYFSCLAVLALLTLRLPAQTIYPVQSSLHLLPPYSVYLSDYAQPGAEKLRVILLQRDLSQSAYSLRLVFSAELNGRVIMRCSRMFNPPPLSLDPGIPMVISGADLVPYLDSRNLDLPRQLPLLAGQLYCGKARLTVPPTCPKAPLLFTSIFYA